MKNIIMGIICSGVILLNTSIPEKVMGACERCAWTWSSMASTSSCICVFIFYLQACKGWCCMVGSSDLCRLVQDPENDYRCYYLEGIGSVGTQCQVVCSSADCGGWYEITFGTCYYDPNEWHEFNPAECYEEV